MSGCDTGASFKESTLNAFMALGKAAWSEARAILTDLLSEHSATLRDNQALRASALHPQSAVTMLLPAAIGDYTDFYSSRNHAYNVGVLIRGKDNALQVAAPCPPLPLTFSHLIWWCMYVCVCSRIGVTCPWATTAVRRRLWCLVRALTPFQFASLRFNSPSVWCGVGTPIRRPNGQTSADQKTPSFGNRQPTATPRHATPRHAVLCCAKCCKVLRSDARQCAVAVVVW